MATMATTHGLTVLTNSCVKPPLNPKTGLSTTMHERARTYMGYSENGFDDDYAADDGRDRRKERTWPSGLAGQDPAVGIEAVSRELLNGVDGEDFYAKLTQLKNEHRKTLEMYESLYKQKVALKQTGKSFVSNENNDQMDVLSKTAPVYDMGDIHDNLTGIEIQKASTIHNIPYTSTANKPPTGRPSKSPSTMPGPKRSRSPPRHAKSLTRSLDEEVWKKVMMQRRSSEEYDFDEDPDGLEATKSEIYDPRDISAAMSRIDDMWENFSVQEYAPGSSTRQRPSSAMITKREKEEKVKEWRHRITIPKPFKMTIREDNKEKKKSQTQLEHEDEMFRRQKEEEIECQKKFKATPVPAHIYLPLYDEIIEKNESRRRHVKDYSEELLKSQEKPFNFLKREEDKRHRRTCSAPSNDKLRKSQTFKARPVPSYIFDTSIDSQIQEEEEYRKIRIKMRSEELLQSAALPPNMELREKVKEMKNKEKMIRSKKKDKFRPKVNHEVPDYDELYKQFQKELARRKYEKETTVTKPFKLNTCNIASTKGKILKDIERDEETMRENRWPFKSSRATPRSSRLGYLSTSLDSIPAKSTAAADLRASRVKKHFTTLSQREKEELEKRRKHRIREMRLRKSIDERALISDSPSIEDKTRERLKRYREDERARMEEYQKELDEMRNRVEGRPLLFEQQSEKNAKKTAEKQFSAKLRSVGLDEDFIQTRSSRTVSMTGDDDDDYEEDFDDTDLKTGVQNEDLEVES